MNQTIDIIMGRRSIRHFAETPIEKEKVEIEIKYEGYIQKQMRQINRFRRLENRKLPEDLDYMAMEGVRIEAREKLAERKPDSVGQASRISGVSPADISVLLMYLGIK